MVVGLGYQDMVPLPPRFDPLPSEITMNVYNTTFRTGLASVVAKQLKGVASRSRTSATTRRRPCRWARHSSATARSDLAAKIAAQHVPGATLRKDERAGTTVDVVIGNAYTALVPEADVPAPAPRPKAETPMVARPCE